MSLTTKALPSLKTVCKGLYQELLVLQNKSNAVHSAKDLEKEKARLQYQKLTAIKEKKSIKEINDKIEALDKGLNNQDLETLADTKLYDTLVGDSKDTPRKINHLMNVTDFLRSQRVYSELLERYNPGLTMQQDDNVRKTANRVGLSVPE